MNINHQDINDILKEEEILQKATKLHWFHWFIVFSSILLTLAVWYFSKKQVEEKIMLRFDRHAEQVIDLVSERMSKYEDALWGGVAAIHSQTHGMDYKEWKRFSDTLKIDLRYPGINGIGVIYHVPSDKLDSFLETEHTLRPDFRIYPPHDEKEYLPITYIEPFQNNYKALGLDMAHESNRYTAALKARDTGEAQVTGPIILVQDSEQTPGFLFFAPFYQGNKEPVKEQRKEKFVGMVYAPFVVKNLMAGVLGQEKRQVSIKIMDGEDVLYDEQESGHNPNPLFKKRILVNQYGRTWIFDIATKKSFEQINKNNQSFMILVGGLTINGLLLLIFFLLSRSSKKALSFANKMTTGYQQQITFLQEAEKEVLRSNMELEKFAYLASHDLQEPLRMVKSFTDLLQEEYEEQLEGDASFYMSQITDGAERMQNLVRDLLDYSQIQEHETELVAVDSQKCLEDAIKNLKGVIRETNADISCDPLPPIHYISMRLTRLFQNLIGNAIKYKKKDENPKIHIGFESQENEWIFSISDNGIGIKEEYLEQVFTLFKRLHNKDEYRGTGIGLSICEKIIDSLGGRLWVTSKFDQGSTFYFSVPKVEEEKD